MPPNKYERFANAGGSNKYSRFAAPAASNKYARFITPEEQVLKDRLPKALQMVNQEAAILEGVNFDKAFEGTERLQNPQADINRLKYGVGNLKDAKKRQGMLHDLAEDMGVQARAFDKTGLDAIKGVGSAVGKTMTVIDTLDRVARHGMTKAFAPDNPETVGEAFLAEGKAGTSRALDKAVEAAKEEGSFGAAALSAVPNELSYPLNALGASIGNTPGFLMHVGAKTIEDPSGFLDHVSEGVSIAKENYLDSWRGESPERVNAREKVYELLLSPTSLLSGSLKGGTKLAIRQGARIGKMLGMEDDAIRVFSDDLAKVAEQYGEAEMPAALKGVLEKHAVDPVQAAKVLGERGEYLGQGGAAIGVPGLGAKGQVDIADVPGVGAGLRRLAGGREQLVRRGVEKLPIDRKLKSKGLNQHERLVLRRRAAEGRYNAQNDVLKGLQTWRDEVAFHAPTKQDGSLDTERMEDLVRHVIDPATRQLGDGSFKATGKIIDDVTPKEQQWMDNMQALFDEHGENFKAMEVISDLAKNKATGRYVPRISDADVAARSKKGIDDLFGKATGRRVVTPDAAKMRGGPEGQGRALGEPEIAGTQRVYDPNEMFARYIPDMKRAGEQKSWDKFLGDHFSETPRGGAFNSAALEAVPNSRGEVVYVDKDIRALMDQQFASMEGSGFFGKVINLFKELNTIPRPGYHAVNVAGDSTLMFTDGFRDPRLLRMANQALTGKADAGKIAFKTPRESITHGQFRRELEQHGISVDQGGGRFDLDPTQNPKHQFDQAAMKAAGAGRARRMVHAIKSNKLEAYKTAATLGMNKVGRAGATWWDTRSKAAFYAYRRRLGDSPKQAAARTYEILPDYGDRGKALNALRKAMPFVTWQAKMMKTLPKKVATRPGTVLGIKRTYEGALGAGEGDTEGYPSPTYQEEMGLAIPLGPHVRKGLNWAMESMTGKPADQAKGMSTRIRDPIFEGLSAPAEGALNQNPEPFMLQLSPIHQMLAEFAFEKDLLTKQDLARLKPSEPLAPGMAATLGLPASLEAPTGQAPWLTRNVLPMITPSLPLLLANMGMGEQRLGRHRDRADNEGEANFLRLLNYLTGLSMAQTRPAGEALNKVFDPRVKQSQKGSRALIKEFKKLK